MTNCKRTMWGSLIAGFLGALGGAESSSKLFRRIGLPLFLAGIAWQELHSWYIFSIFLMFPIFSIGYGLPSGDDKGSPLGRFFYILTNGNELYANILTRGLVGALIGITLSPIAVLKHNYILYIIGYWLIKSVFAFLSWRSLGVFDFQGKRLIYAEFIPYATVGLVTLCLIYF